MKKRFFIILFSLFMVFPLFLLIHIVWWIPDMFYKPYERFHYLYMEPQPVSIKNDKVYLTGETRIYQEVVLTNPYTGATRFTVSFPDYEINEALPVIILLGGLEIGQYSLNYIEQQGNNILIAYEYPYRPRYWYDKPPLLQLEWIRQSAMMVPDEILQIIHYIKNQSWYRGQGFVLLGYSFGAMFLPSVCHKLSQNQISVTGIIMAYGGSELYPVLYANFKGVPSIFRSLLSGFVYCALHPLEPSRFLDSFHDIPLLIINGKFDRKIPPESFLPLHSYFEENTEIILLPSGHMHPRKKELIRTIVENSRRWLTKKGLANP